MKSANSYLVAAFVIAFSVLLVIPMWAAYGVLFPKDGGHGHGHGPAEQLPTAAEFEQRTSRFIEKHQLPDGSVRADPGEPVPVMVARYTFRPNILRLRAGAEYELRMLSPDVIHAISIQMGGSSYNAVVMPHMVTTLKLKTARPGAYLVVCNEYCGIGHDYMHFSIIVEEGDAEMRHLKPGQEHDGHANRASKGNEHAGGNHK